MYAVLMTHTGIDRVNGDVTTSSPFPAYVVLNHSDLDPTPVSVPVIAPKAGFLLLDFAASGVPTSAGTIGGASFRLLVDGVPVANSDRGAAVMVGTTFDLSLVERVAVGSGSHVVTVEWSSFDLSAQILRASDPGFEGATLRAEFVTP